MSRTVVCDREIAVKLPPPVSAWFAETAWSPDNPPTDLVSSRSSARRRSEFAAGRRAATQAAVGGGLDLGSLPSGAHGAPAWPTDVVGSITHCPGYAAAAVAHSHLDPARTIGIDAEPWLPLKPHTFAFVATEREARHVRDLQRREPRVPWCRLLFTAKEATYKALRPTGTRVTFSQAEVSFAGRDIAVDVSTGPGYQLLGSWWQRPRFGVVLTALSAAPLTCLEAQG